MALSALIPDGSDLTGLCRHKLEGIFDMHGVKIGSRADIPGFLEKLYSDRYFAMDFWALVDSLECMPDRISEEQIRRTVAECVGGWLPKGDPALAQIDEAFDAHFPGRRGSTAEAQPDDAGLRIIEYKDSMQDAAGTDEHGLPVVELGAAAASGGLGRIDQILSRLELNDHELKLLLESIESRISRLEPHVEELTAQVVRPHGSAAARGRAIQQHGRLAVDRVGQQLAAANVAVGIWGTRTFGRMDSGLDKAGRRFAAMDVAAARLRSRAIESLDLGWASAVKIEARARAAVIAAVLALASGMKRRATAAMNWVEHQRAMLVHVGTTLGVVACLLLVIWLWGRPRGYMARATPVAASSTVAMPTAAMPAAVVKTEPAVQTEPAETQPAQTEPATPSTAETPAGVNTAEPLPKANVDAQLGSEDEPASEVRTVATKVTVAKRGDYTAPPWTKWYDEDGAEAPAPPAATTAAVGSGGESPAKGAPAAKDTAR